MILLLVVSHGCDMQDAAHYEKLRVIVRGIQLYSLERVLAFVDVSYRFIGHLIVVLDCIYLNLQTQGQDRPYDFMSDDLDPAYKK